MPDIKDYKLNSVFTNPGPDLNAEGKAILKQVKSIRTTPRDPRFPAFNQAGHCFNRYNEWLVCLKQTEGDEDGCQKLRQLALNICPSIWTDKWDEERDEGNFPGVKV
jgi:cytochrome c oxidase subunit 6b